MAARFWVGGTGNWSDATNHWATTSGGAPGAGNLPTSADDVTFDTASNATAYTCTIDATTKVCNNITFGAPASGNMTLAGSAAGITISGSMTMYSGLILTYNSQLITFNSTSTGKTITTAGVSLTSNDLSFDGVGGGWTLQDDLTTTSGSLGIVNGTFDANNKNVSVGQVSSSNSNVRTITMGSGTWTLGASFAFSQPWILTTVTNLTLNANTSTIKIVSTTGTVTFAGGGKTYNNLWFSRGAGAGSITITGSNTFADFKDDGTVAHSILFTAGTTQTVTTFTVNGTAGQEITINSTTTATHALVKSGGGTITCNYLNIQHSVATPGSTWTANNSTNNQAVATAGSGWSFGGVANTGSGFLMCF